MGSADHFTDDEMAIYCLGRVRVNDGERLERHVVTCLNCRRRLLEMAEYVAVMKAALWGLVMRRE